MGYAPEYWVDADVGRMTEEIATHGDLDLSDWMGDAGKRDNGTYGVWWDAARKEGYTTDEIASMAADGFEVPDA